MKKKTVIVFPGVGYHTDKPLLYYGKKLAKEYGYEVVEVPYGGFESGMKGNAHKMKAAFESAMIQTKEILERKSPDLEGDLLIISKSIGTVVASAWQKLNGIKAKNIYFTPVEATFSYVQPDSGIVFHGTADSWAETAAIKNYCEKLGLPLYITENANHSMETGDTVTDLKHLEQMMDICRDYISDQEK